MTANQSKLSVRVRPGAPRNEIIGCAENTWTIKVAAPPVEGKANRELIAFLSERLGVGKSAISIINGLTARRKLLAVSGLSPEEISERLSPRPSSDASGGAPTRK